ncbi:MAG: hypothetical protein WAV16_00455 [Candidatus Moraniibacteriota bacterium]
MFEKKSNKDATKLGVKYYGSVASVPGNDGFAFIGIQTVTTEEGGPPIELHTKEDIFLHQDDCANQLVAGMCVIFSVAEDRHRGKGFYRAFGATEVIDAEIIPSEGGPFTGFHAMTEVKNNALVSVPPRANYHIAAKEVSPEAVSKVLENEPMQGVPRDTGELPEEAKIQLLAVMLSTFFPTLTQFSANFNILDMSNEELDREVADNETNLEALGMTQQIEEIRKEVENFKGMKATLKLILDDGLVRPDTIIPIKYLPDLFMAVPVWYFWVKPEALDGVTSVWASKDPHPQAEIKYFCDLFPNQNWSHTYQMFNRRMRSLKMYKGDKVPPFVSRRLCKAVEAFDYIVIATPYHEEAGKDWQDIAWLQLIDPYVLGFKKGIPYFFILARFSDTGTFPLYFEMVADTIEFLEKNKGKLNGFDQVDDPYWHRSDKPTGYLGHQRNLGKLLIRHTDELIGAFEKGDLFDWLRGEVGQYKIESV